MAPEQLSTGIPLSERTDIYALGLILYELLVGQPALDVRSLIPRKPAKPSALVSDVNRTLERAILNAIAPDPRDRPASALEMSDLLVSDARRWSGPRMAIVGGAAALILLMLALASVFSLRPANPALTEHDTIILADFQNTTGEPVFDSALKVALAVALEQSPFIKVFPDDRVRQTLQLMQRSPDEAVTRSVAREVARREQLKALISGSIATLGSHYVLALEAISAETGDVMAREHIEVSSKEQVLSQLGTATARLREKLGESLTTIKRFDVPLAQATTASLDALHAYSRALEQGQFVPRAEAIPHLVRALELDPNFAMAHALLSGVYSNIGRSSEAPVHAYQAFELRNRVSERERFFISWRYYRDAEQAWDKALDLAQSWTRTYPREAFAFNSLGIAAAAFGQHEQAVLAFREAIRLDPKFVPPYANLAGSLIAVNRFEEANEAVKSAAAHGLDFNAVRRMAYLRAFLSGDSRAMQRELDLLRGTPLAMWAPIWEARTSAYSGRIQAAHKLFQLGAEAARREGFDELAAQWTMEDVESHAIVGQCRDVDREVAAGLGLSRDNFTLERAGRALAFCSLAGESSRLSTELRTRFSNATLTMRLQLPVIAAATEVARGDFRRALEMLEPVKPYDEAPAAELWATFLRGQAYLGLNDGRAALSEFQNILDRRGAAPTSPLYPLAHLGRARAAALARDDAEARTSYESFLTLWDTADPGVRALEDARRELARFR
jgi:tetratricopeptide (TPR) repeat protein